MQSEMADKKTILSFIKKAIDENSIVYADDYRAYNGIASNQVKHSSGKYVDGNVHTNSIESFRALFKRGYIGIYHYMSKKHLQRYINEFATRFNANRSELGNYPKFVNATMNVNHRLTYKGLIHG